MNSMQQDELRFIKTSIELNHGDSHLERLQLQDTISTANETTYMFILDIHKKQHLNFFAIWTFYCYFKNVDNAVKG